MFSPRLTAPATTADRDALAIFANSQDQIQYGELPRDVSFFTGFKWFPQDVTVPASCPTCASLPDWQPGWISDWSDTILPASTVDLPSNLTASPKVKYGQDGIISWLNSQGLEVIANLPPRALCEYKKCDGCVFPFIYGGRKYDTCVTHGTTDGSSWCSTEVDDRGYHVDGSTQPCPTDCPQNDCPVGFRIHLKTCLQESSSTRTDNPISIAMAEEECLFQGGRLYQPRSTRWP